MEPNHGSLFPGEAMSYAVHQEGISNGGLQHPISYQNRTNSFHSDTSVSTASSSSAFSEAEQETFYASANGGYNHTLDFDDNFNHDLLFQGVYDTPTRSRLTFGVGLLNFNA